tara:strand:- start:342 stop:509 length:168 start_codon:yes stop_codon:yes gene_type:complete
MSGLITIFQTIFYFVALCFCVGTLIWLIKDVRIYRKEVLVKIWNYIKEFFSKGDK